MGFAIGKMSLISQAKIWRALQKMGWYWAEEYTTSQLHCCSRTEINKVLLASVILFKRLFSAIFRLLA